MIEQGKLKKRNAHYILKVEVWVLAQWKLNYSHHQETDTLQTPAPSSLFELIF